WLAPDVARAGGGLGGGRGGEGVRGNAGQREWAEREPPVPAELLFDLLDRVEGLPRVRALVVAVLEDQAAGGRAADVVDVLVQWRQGHLAAIRHRVPGHGRGPPGAAGGFGLLDSLEPELVVEGASGGDTR